MNTIRVVLPAHLRTLARIDGEVKLEIDVQATQHSVLNSLETRYPMLRGTIRDQVTQQRRPSSGSTPVNRICPMNDRTPRYPRL